jgi:hypothetical protein
MRIDTNLRELKTEMVIDSIFMQIKLDTMHIKC